MAFKSAYFVASADFSIPSTHRPEVPGGQAREKKEKYLCEWYLVCLNCNLPVCYQDDSSRKSLTEGRELCPIVIGKRKKWTPERVLNDLC